MFESIKLYLRQRLDIGDLQKELVDFGYVDVVKVAEEGEFSSRGEVLDIFPVTFDWPVRIQFADEVIEKIRNFDPLTGEYLQSHQIVIILPINRLRPKKVRAPFLGLAEEIPIDSFVDIHPGDYVVHIEHGIGIYRGIKKIKLRQRYKDHFVIEYRDKDLLYVPYEDLHMIQRYIGFEGRPPRLYKLGGRLWKKVKEKTRKGVYLLAYELLELQAKRAMLSGMSFSKDTDWQRQLESEFPYEDTPDQRRSTLEVKKDMELPKPMDRLLCGDVGYGKTEVALRAAFKAVMDNKQVAILVPTTILAEQHYNTFTQRLSKYPVNVQMLSRFKSESEQKAIVEGLQSGTVDIVIGTHRLLSDDIAFKDLGLVIIDEEQRFGVRHKEKLKRLRLLVDVLTMTATPIPRTLYMALMGAKDLSIINTPPKDRQPVETHILEFDEEVIKDAIRYELSRKGQVYFIHNRIQGIEGIARLISRLVPEARIQIAHGRLPEKNLEETIIKFMRGEIDVLVSTAIVESGIDIPNANTIFVNRADLFGLADLYQLRGRVGRFKRKAYAYFLIEKKYVMTQDVEKRLRTLKKFTSLGAGFNIAMEDLQMRGAGNILGAEQHGFIESVGFDLYCRLLKSAIQSMKEGRKINPREHKEALTSFLSIRGQQAAMDTGNSINVI